MDDNSKDILRWFCSLFAITWTSLAVEKKFVLKNEF